MGSEMCIRDSFAGEASDAPLPFQAAPGDLSKRERTAAHVAWDNICLLYTSDAADERSSVDLGGRRIIKKKKTACMTESPLESISHSYLPH